MNTIKYLLILFFGTVISYGQQMPNIMPPSPEASAVFKFAEIPVSLYTGLPNINIPLFEIESGGVNVPISISYHARGIQVAEVGSRVGIGWALNCGGMITKQVRDKDDALQFQCVDYSKVFSDLNERNSVSASTNLGVAETCDMLPDQYSFSVNGVSGKLIPDLIGGGSVTQQYTDFSVSEGAITDGKGNKYIFGENNATDNDMIFLNRVIHNTDLTQTPPQGAASFSNYPNTWHLTTIKTAQNTEIKYYYTKETTYHTRRSYDKVIGPHADSYTSDIRNEQQRLDSISFDKGKLKFEYTEAFPEEMPGNYSLHKIILYNKEGQAIKQAIFDYEYTTSEIDYVNINWYLAEDSSAYKRLFLKTVQFADKDGNTLPPYSFDYNPIVLPSRHSNSVDVWGYYNGKNNGTFLETYYDDLSVDVEKVQAGLLQTMTKPEGGQVKFYYEPNIAVNVFPNSIAFANPNPSYHRVVTLSPLDANPQSVDEDNVDENNNPVPKYNGNGDYSDIFEVSEYRTSLITSTAHGYGIAACQCNSPVGCPVNPVPNPDCPSICQFTISILKFNPVTNTFGNSFLIYPGTRTISLDPGKYKLKVDYTGSTPYSVNNQCQSFFVSINWHEEITSQFIEPAELTCVSENYSGTKVIHGAGNRIRKIEYIESPDSDVVLTKTYSYTNPQTGQASGRILGLTSFVSLTEDTLNGQPANAESDPWGSGGGSIFSTYQGNNVGYKFVTEYYGDGDNTIGKTEYEYSMIYDTGRYYEFPYHPPTDNEWLRGKELNVKVYKKQGNSYQMVKKTQNTYLLGDSLELASPLTNPLCNHPFFKPSLRIPMVEDFEPNGGYVKNNRYYNIPATQIPVKLPSDTLSEGQATGYKIYYMTGGTLDLKKSLTTEYLDNGTQMLNTTDYSYRYDYHYNVAQVSQATSDAAPLLTKYLYANDPEVSDRLAVPDLLANNMKQVPLVTQTFKGTAKLSETETVFKDWNPNDTIRLMQPQYVKMAKGNNGTEARLEYKKIDSANGNILEVKQTNGISIAYIWGYKGTYPLAKIENATFAQVATALGTTEAALKALTVVPANIRTLLPNAMITTFTYKPLVGVTSITDPKGDVLNYEYDVFGRLKFVRDKWGNALSENQYIYGQ
ncbi:hypothetical protein ACLI09_12490 [Flavobacterium sp. RHBU_24]|uniref:hypothetical protein n=1 Tax=Flavobacterium sp. RHBU_24 TaxID=3391185 RepID=UPI0039846E7B